MDACFGGQTIASQNGKDNQIEGGVPHYLSVLDQEHTRL